MLGAVAGRSVVAPPEALLGNNLQPGNPDAIIAWLNASAPHAPAYALSSDMLAYGGLIASRVPGPSYADAYMRLREIDRLRARYDKAWIGVFGTVMRLAPTGVPANTPYFAAYPIWSYLQQYANLHDPLESSEVDEAQRLRGLIGDDVLNEYLQTRARNYAVDHLLIDKTIRGTINRLVLGQDDAKPYGLHVPEVRALAQYSGRLFWQFASIEPGADELGMAMVANALARGAHWQPVVDVYYSTPEGAAYQDPLEFTPIDSTIDSLIGLCGGLRANRRDTDVEFASPQNIQLFVRLPDTGSELDQAFLASIRSALDAGESVAVVDLSFEKSYDDQKAFADALLSSGLASRLDAYAAWNTGANTVGTALAETVAAGAGRRMHTYNRLAHQTFTFLRFIDDVDFHDDVRPAINAWLAAQGVTDHTLLAPDVAAATAQRNRALLWYEAQTTLSQLYPQLHIASMSITLPWDRTFDTQIDVRLAPNL
jgi:hypothetical protein